MAVQRFRSIEEMNAAPILRSTQDGFERFVRHCQRYWQVAPRVYPRGVFRYHTLAEAQSAREALVARGPIANLPRSPGGECER